MDRPGARHREADAPARTTPTPPEPVGRRPGRWDASVRERFPDRVWLLATGILVVTLPALTLLVAYVALTATRSVAIGRLTPVEAVELYLIEVVAFAAFSYLLYRLTLYSARRQGSAEDDGPTVGPTAERGEADSVTDD